MMRLLGDYWIFTGVYSRGNEGREYESECTIMRFCALHLSFLRKQESRFSLCFVISVFLKYKKFRCIRYDFIRFLYLNIQIILRFFWIPAFAGNTRVSVRNTRMSVSNTRMSVSNTRMSVKNTRMSVKNTRMSVRNTRVSMRNMKKCDTVFSAPHVFPAKAGN